MQFKRKSDSDPPVKVPKGPQVCKHYECIVTLKQGSPATNLRWDKEIEDWNLPAAMTHFASAQMGFLKRQRHLCE